jgi:hypothetical protein
MRDLTVDSGADRCSAAGDVGVALEGAARGSAALRSFAAVLEQGRASLDPMGRFLRRHIASALPAGIGNLIARALAAAGQDVYASMRDPSARNARHS